MDTVKILEVKENVFDANEVNARTVREQLTKEGRLVINVMSSPGSGKTTMLVRTINMLHIRSLICCGPLLSFDNLIRVCFNLLKHFLDYLMSC